MTSNKPRIGNFTSSEIVALISTGKQNYGFGTTAITYISETNMERMLGCSIDTEINARPLTWGKHLEPFVNDNYLPTSYQLTSAETFVHPDIDYWAGSPDGFVVGEDVVFDIKCPITLKSFVMLVLPLYCGLTGIKAMNAIRQGFRFENLEYPKHKDGDKYYWQLVSNAVITNKTYAELIVFMPSVTDLKGIKERAEGDVKKYWIWASDDNELPCLPAGCRFSSINKIRFEVPNEDKELIKANVLKGGQLLVPKAA